MKRTPEEERVLERMAPGVLSRHGFLGQDRRSLGEVLAADQAEVDRLGLTHEEIAAALRQVLEAARRALGRPVEVRDNLSAVYYEALGRIPSPWPGEGVFPKGEVELKETPSGKTVRFTPLSVHLIETHGFYEGRGSRYRLEPSGVARMLGLTEE